MNQGQPEALVGTCERCGEPLEAHPAAGRPRRYCGLQCWEKGRNARKRLLRARVRSARNLMRAVVALEQAALAVPPCRAKQDAEQGLAVVTRAVSILIADLEGT
jgi:class 3 adenylate cyclase